MVASIYQSELPSERITSRDRLSAVVKQGGELISVEDAVKALTLSPIAAAKLLSRWKDQGWLSRIRRGLYAPVPLASSASDKVLEDPWTLVTQLFAPGYVGGASAAHHWDLTEQLFRSVFVYTAHPVRRVNQTIHGTPFVVRHVAAKRIFGTKPLWRGRIRIQVSDVHRTIIDMLNTPTDGGGIRHVADCLTAYLRRDDVAIERLIEYAERVGNGAVFKRLGFLVEREGGPADLVEACAARITRGIVKLDPSLPSPFMVSRWGLWVPEHWKTKTPPGDD